MVELLKIYPLLLIRDNISFLPIMFPHSFFTFTKGRLIMNYDSFNRRKNKAKVILWLSIILGLIFWMEAIPGMVLAQEKYPSRPITFVIGYPAGGMTDTSARPLVSAASKILGQPIVVVNKPGGGSVVAMAALKNEKPDGYTIGILTTGGTLSQYMRKVPYDSAKDLTPIMQHVVHLYGLVVRSDSPWKTFKEFIDYAKTNPGKIRYSTAGPGTPQHLVMERLALKEQVKWTHIPFEGGAPAVSALLGGHVEACSQTTEWKTHVEAGRLRGLALYAEKRASGLPNVPTLLEMGYNIVAPGALCLVGPKGIPPQIVETLHRAFKKAMEDPDYIRVCQQTDQVIVYRGPQELAQYQAEVHEVWGSLITSLGLRKD
jgi:tripartite-type tricarboxylate transporter receptor subunit TctC